MSPSPAAYIPLTDTLSQPSSESDGETLFIVLASLPYTLITLLVHLHPSSLAHLFIFLVLLSLLHFYVHPHIIARVFPSVSPESRERKLWVAGNFQLANIMGTCMGSLAARMGEDFSSADLAGLLLAFTGGGCGSFAAWNFGR
jgi:hypothetical protein